VALGVHAVRQTTPRPSVGLRSVMSPDRARSPHTVARWSDGARRAGTVEPRVLPAKTPGDTRIRVVVGPTRRPSLASAACQNTRRLPGPTMSVTTRLPPHRGPASPVRAVAPRSPPVTPHRADRCGSARPARPRRTSAARRGRGGAHGGAGAGAPAQSPAGASSTKRRLLWR